MPPRSGRRRPPMRRPAPARERQSSRIEFDRRVVPMPATPVVLRDGSGDQWELICRDGWEWQHSGAGKVAVRVATLTAEQAEVVQAWIERIKDPATWWAVSREMTSPNSSPEVAAAVGQHPWLLGVLPVLLEASVDGAPPPPPEAQA